MKWLIKLLIKNHHQTQNHDVREAYGILAGGVGILCNLVLFVLKLVIGVLMNSIAIISDAFNNLSDTGSSIVAIVGAKLSNTDPDHEHPYGHGRFEYIASLMIAFIIMLVGFELLKSSFGKILNPIQTTMHPWLILILVLSVFVKIWMYRYNKYIGELIDSSVNLAASKDSLNDVVATSVVILTTFLGQWTDLPLDGLAGLGVSVLVILTGFELAKDTVNLLLGMSPSDEMVQAIMDRLNASPLIKGAHDLKVHDYGPGRTIASVHTEISDQTNLIQAHAVIDALEKQIFKELGIDIVIHVDPIAEGQIGPID